MGFAKILCGALPAAYQTEGSPRADGGGESIWDTFAAAPAPLRTERTARWPRTHTTDTPRTLPARRGWGLSLSVQRELGAGGPKKGSGEWNDAGFAFYLRMLKACRAAGLDPYVTLYHWELPQALEEAGGWRNQATAHAFARYAAEAAGGLGPWQASTSP